MKDRTQSVYFNGSSSNLKKIGNQGCFQGTIVATLLDIIYVLDQPTIVHKKCNHENNYNENEKCDGNYSMNYIDDNVSQIISNRWNNIQNETVGYLRNQKDLSW